jgi:hypothetical protein
MEDYPVELVRSVSRMIGSRVQELKYVQEISLSSLISVCRMPMIEIELSQYAPIDHGKSTLADR